MNLFSVVLLALAGSAYAAPTAYHLEMDVSMEGKHVSSPRVVVNEGEPATIKQNSGKGEKFLEVVATESKTPEHPGILMKFVIGTIDPSGVRTILGEPQIIAREGEPATLVQRAVKNGEETLSISVVAKKKTL